MKQYEYKSIDKNLLFDEHSGDFDLRYINGLGLEGWEISMENNGEVLLKREVVERGRGRSRNSTRKGLLCYFRWRNYSFNHNRHKTYK
ncbi:hypothetical protein RBTH_08827 [Bacillus thuringiensis serovar israelensis ATCC 35646]|nr:hypothetical protein RBTH_08827 [Bacillus thuringiensis serovar israelensis ATCC 35646]